MVSSFHRSEGRNTEQEEADKYPGLHKDAGHAYSQDVLSFMLGREGKSVYIWNNINANKQRENGNNSEKDTKGTRSHSAPVRGLNQQKHTILNICWEELLGGGSSNGVKELEHHLLARSQIATSICDSRS